MKKCITIDCPFLKVDLCPIVVSPSVPETIGQATEEALEAFLGSGCRIGDVTLPDLRPRSTEFGGELSKHDVDRLKDAGYEVLVYRHKGTTATVVRRNK